MRRKIYVLLALGFSSLLSFALVVQECGDGRLEALSSADNDVCPGIGSQISSSVTSLETCDVSKNAAFGNFSAGCGIKSGNCVLAQGVVMELEDQTAALDRSAQLQWGMITQGMANYNFNPYDTSSTIPKINPCLYSSQMVDANGQDTSVIADAKGCKITTADRTKYTALTNCYGSGASHGGVTSGTTTTADLDAFGARLDSNDANFALNGHKCQWPASVQIDSAAGGQMTWTETPRDPTTDKIIAPFDGLYDVCFTISDPSWPAVHPSSNEFLQQMTRIQYEVVCDPLDQEEAYPDPDNNCETNNAANSYRNDPEQHSHKCTRMGNRKNPCSDVHKTWELYSCDGTSCESLEGLKSTYNDRYGVSASTGETGVKYTFEHDSAASKNRFGCTTKQFDNVELQANGYMLGDATEAQSRYICATGGQDTPCDPGMGEIVHHIDTCSTGTSYRDIEALKAAVGSDWKDLSTYDTNNCATDADAAGCEDYKKFRDLQQYAVGCDRKLKIRVQKGVSGQMMLRVVARNYNTAVDDSDPDKGYTYWTSSLVPVSIEARVRDLEAVHNPGRAANVGTVVSEKGSLDFLSSGLATNPFSQMMVSQFDQTAESTRISRFSRSTRTHMEFIECTSSHLKLAVENDETVPRFRVNTDAAFASNSFGGDYKYYPDYLGDTGHETNRIYEISTQKSYDAPAIHQLQAMVPHLTLRAEHDLASNAAWWSSANAGLTTLDSWHEGYSNHSGICLITRLYAFEPSSCHSTVIDSAPYFIEAKPVNSDATPSVSFEQTTLVWDEDTTVPLKISVAHSGSNDDSKMWYFSHIEIEDLNHGSHTQQDGGDFDLFSYGNTVGDSSGGSSDAVTLVQGITKISSNKWRSFANRCTRWIFESGAQGGDASKQGGFSSPELDHQGFADAEACLNDARRQGELIWGDAAVPNTKTGVHLRPFRKMTKNLNLKVTVYMYDGDAFGWHSSDSTLEQTASNTLRLLHVPATTRYNQEEIKQTDQTMDENGNIVISFNQAADRTDGVGLPMPYRAGAHVCTYTKVGTDGTELLVDEVDTTMADHDRVCDPASNPPNGADAQGGSTCPSGVCFGSTVGLHGCTQELGYRVSCNPSGADASRASIETVVMFDESEGSNSGSTVYTDGSAVWVDGPMVMPEQIAYQPAGKNTRAKDEEQWYRIEPCTGTTGASDVYWCTDTSSVGYSTVTGDTTATTICDITQKGAGHDPATAPSSVTTELLNSLSTDASGAIISTVDGYGRNFWAVKHDPSSNFLAKGSLCMQGRSDFNTEDATYDPTARSPVNLRLVVVALDSVTAHSGVDAATPTWNARSKSNTDQGAFSVAVERIRQLATPSLVNHMWQEDYTIGSSLQSVSFIEERNDHSRDQVPAQKTWSDIATSVGGALTENVDCGAGNTSDTMCLDRLRWQEQTDFHDQHLGRIEIKGYMQKTCGADGVKMGPNEWLDAGGLFEVYTQYVDDYLDYGDANPGHGFALNEGAGFRISDSHEAPCTNPGCASQIVTQDFNAAEHGTQIAAGQPGGSICRIILDDGDSGNATITSIRATPCHIRPSLDVVGHNTFTWSNTILARVIANKCHKPPGGAGAFTCPPGALTAREIASNLRFRLPHKWSNCVRFRFDVTVSNDDRTKPAFTFQQQIGASLVNYRSDSISAYVEPQQRAEEPIMWIGSDLADDANCLGNPNAAGCAGKAGVQAIGDLDGSYSEIDATTNLDGNDGEAMSQITLVAGYRTQIRVLASSGATDYLTEHQAPPHPLTVDNGDYKWDSLRASREVSGEAVYLTVESKYSAMTSKPNQRFCLWLCPAATAAGSGCNKNSLIRLRALDDSDDFTTTNVNCKPCTSGANCLEYGMGPDGTPLKCEDPYGRDDDLMGCPTYSPATPFHNPSSRYSFKCTKTGHCPELRNLYIQYPADQIEDDVLEFGLWSRADWQGAAGYQRARVSMNVLMKPSITLSEVGYAIEQVENCDVDTPGNYNCSTGLFGSPLQPGHTVSVVPSANPPISIAIHETKLHGSSACSALSAEADLASKGSAHDVTTDCGIRFPVNFIDDTLTAVAPVGVKFEIRAGSGIDAKTLAQSLRMLCTTYARESTGAEPSKCIEEFVALNPSVGIVTDADLLRFQSEGAPVQADSVTRLINADDFFASVYPASHLSWNVGELMAQKEMILYGADTRDYTETDYSLENNRCEGSRTFTVDLEHQVGYSPAVVAETRSSINVEVVDDDFYGKVELAGISTSAQLVPLQQLVDADPTANSASMAKIDWNGDTVDTPFSVYLMRSRMASESDTVEKRSVHMKALRAWVKVDLGGLNTNEFNVTVSKIHGQTDQLISTYTLTAAQVVQGDGVTPNMIYVDFPASSTCAHDCKVCDDPNEACYYYKCDCTEGDPSADIPFQWFKISFQAAGPASGCAEGGDKNIVFNIEKVVYDSSAGAALDEQTIDCGTDTTRNPLSASAKALTYTQLLTIQPEDPQLKAPFQVSFAGFDPTSAIGAEGTKDSPITWNAGLDGTSYISLHETEHSACTSNGGSGYTCPPRTFKMHLCMTLRDALLSPPEDWSTWNADTFRFFTGVQDSSDTWSQIGNKYDLQCPTAQELDQIRSAASGVSQLDCTRVSTIEEPLAARSVAVYCEGPEYDAMDAQKKYDYCGDHVPKRLMWTVSTQANGAEFAFACPTASTAAIEGAAGPWEKLPFLVFENKDDAGAINLSRKPELCINNGKLPDDLVSGANTDTCSAVSNTDCVKLRIEDDEVFAQNNAVMDADISTMEADFGEPVWDSVNGKLNIDIKNRYYHQPQDKTLVNVGLGVCEPETASNPAMNIRAFWEQHSGTANNPVTSGTSAFGDCDLLTVSSFDGSLTNGEMFEALFGSSSAQPTSAQYDTLAAAGKLFGFSSADGVTGSNTLFTPKRVLGNGGEWIITGATVDDHDNADLSTKGFNARLSLSLERLQQCRDRLGNPIVGITVNNGNTQYEFTVSSTHVSAQRSGDSSYHHYSPICTERKYTLSVSNKLFALSGLSTGAQNNAIYVDDMGYKGPVQNVCTAHTDCDATIGPKHRCPADASEYNQNTLKSMEYFVNMDMRNVVNNIGGVQVTSFFGLADVQDVSVNADNCYNAMPESVSALSADGSYTEAGVTRTRLGFRTACAELRTHDGSAYGLPVADAFATCADAAAQSTDYSFKVRLWECTSLVGMQNPRSPTSGCQMLPDWLHVSIAMAFTEDPTSVTYEVQFEKLMRFYKSHDHRLGDGTFPPTAAGVVAWRDANVLQATAAEPFVKYPVDAMVTASIGFVENSALEAVMTTAIRDVRLCRFKEFCHLPGVSTDVAGATACSWANMVQDGTHSPFANWARNIPLGNDNKGCADVGATVTCPVNTVQTGVAVPDLTCARDAWENFAVAEAQAYMTSSVNRTNLLSNIVGGIGNTPSVAILAIAFDPVVEAVLVVDRGTTTTLAESIYGNCEKNTETTAAENVLDSSDAPTGISLTHIFPKAPANAGPVGACTCKGQRAYGYSQDGGATHPYRSRANRKVIYDDEYYNNDVADAANLHKCTWRNSPQHSIDVTPLNSVDQFTMSLQRLQRNTDYFFEIAAVQYDHQAFDAATLSDPNAEDQYAMGDSTSRRLLEFSHNIPRAALHQHAAAHNSQAAPPSRRTLSLMMPVSDHQTTSAVMPQGAVALQEASSQGAFSSGGTAGFVVEGPEMDLTQQELDNLETEHKDIAYDEILECVREGKSMEKCEENKAKTFFQYTKGSDWGQWVAFTWEGGSPLNARYVETLEYVLFDGMLDFDDFENKLKASLGMLVQTSLLVAGATGLAALGNLVSNSLLPAPKPNGARFTFPSGSMFSLTTPYKGWLYETHFFRFFLKEDDELVVEDQTVMWWPETGAGGGEYIICVMMWIFCIIPNEFGLILSGSYIAAVPFVVFSKLKRLGDTKKDDDDKQKWGWMMIDASLARLMSARDSLVKKFVVCSTGIVTSRVEYYAYLMLTIVLRLTLLAVGPVFYTISLLIAIFYYAVKIGFTAVACFHSSDATSNFPDKSRSSAFEVEAPRGARAHPSPPQYAEEDAVSETDSLTKTTATTKFSF